MLRQYLKVIKWLVIISALVTFLGQPLIPAYGWMRPWSEAKSAMRGHGIKGALFMVGGSWSGRYSSSAGVESWSKERERTFMAIPESFRTGDLFTYVEKRESGIAAPQTEFIKTKGLFFLVAIWLLSSVVSVVMICRWTRRWLINRASA